MTSTPPPVLDSDKPFCYVWCRHKSVEKWKKAFSELEESGFPVDDIDAWRLVGRRYLGCEIWVVGFCVKPGIDIRRLHAAFVGYVISSIWCETDQNWRRSLALPRLLFQGAYCLFGNTRRYPE